MPTSLPQCGASSGALSPMAMLKRLLRLFLAYMGGCYAAALLLLLAGGPPLLGGESWLDRLLKALALAVLGAPMIAVVVAVPALVLIAFLERRGRAAPLLAGALGALLGAAAALLMGGGDGAPQPLLYAVAGAAGGLVHARLAGTPPPALRASPSRA